MSTSTVVGLAVLVASIALHSDGLLYWIGPAGCIILIPAVIIVLALPLIQRDKTAKKSRIEVEVLPPEMPPASGTGTLNPIANLIGERGTLSQDQLQPGLGLFSRAFAGSPLHQNVLALLDNAERVQFTERHEPDGARERSVTIFYPKKNV
jgi:hypothetical protein